MNSEPRNEVKPAVVSETENARVDLEMPRWQTSFVVLGMSRTYQLHLQVPPLNGLGRRPSGSPAGRDALHRHFSQWSAGAYLRNPTPMHLWPEGALTISPRTHIQYAPATDDRSLWAQWHGTLWGATATMGAAMFTTVAVLSLLPRDVSGWKNMDFYGLKRTFRSGPNFDYDHAFFNYIAHPYDGSEFYLLARNRECNWFESFLYGAAISSTFEFLIESAYEGASWQDLWITPVSGAVIGELRWQAKKALEDPKTGKPVGTVNQILHVLVDPVDAVLNL